MFRTRTDELFIKVDGSWIGPLSSERIAAWNINETSDIRPLPDRMTDTAGAEVIGVHRGNGDFVIDRTATTKPLLYCGGKELEYAHFRWTSNNARTAKPTTNAFSVAGTNWTKETGKLRVIGYDPVDDSGGLQHRISIKLNSRRTYTNLPTA